MGQPAVSVCLIGMKDMADFLRTARGQSVGKPGFHLQARQRKNDIQGPARTGFTCSKRVGNAVARNRAKRRLRAAARAVLSISGQAGWDYVLIGRKDATANIPFDRLLDDLREAIAQLHP